jgi:hypothetical protein
LFGAVVSSTVPLCRYFNPSSEPLELDSRFWELRDSIVQCELLMLRVLRFQVSFQHPHKVCAYWGAGDCVQRLEQDPLFHNLKVRPPNVPKHVRRRRAVGS